MKQRLLTGLVILLVIVGAITAINYFSGKGGVVVVEDFETNEYTEKISGKINDMQSKRWDEDKLDYKNIAFQIGQYQDGSLITEKAAAGLNQLLENAYSKQLKDTAFNYCVKARNLKGWDRVNKELLRYDESGINSVTEAVGWMSYYKNAYYAIYGAIRHAREKEYTEAQHTKYTKRFETYNAGPVSQNTSLFKGSGAKILQARPDLINHFRVADRFSDWNAQFLPLSDTTGFSVMTRLDAANKIDLLKTWQSSCNCNDLKELIDNQFYNSQCDSLHQIADEQIALLKRI